VLAAIAVSHFVGVGWGLPASDGWDNDGVAPRDFLAGLVETLTPGKYYTYPPFHLALLAVVTLPVTLTALARAPALTQAGVLGTILQVPYMTAIALLARLVTVAMSVGVAYAAAKVAEELRGERAGLLAAGACGVSGPFAYYAHMTNLDVPYLFWASLALLAFVRAIARHEPRRLRAAVAFAVLAIGTKDQAYGMFLAGGPAAIVAWLAFDPWARKNGPAVGKHAAVAAGMGAALLLVVDCVVFNPSGFRERLRFLTGPASQDFAHYSNDWAGRALAAKDALFTNFDQHYPLVLAPFVCAGLLVAARAKDPARRAAGLVPLLAALSFTLLFNCTARRTEHRFLLPQMFCWSTYAGLALDALVERLRPRQLAWATVGGVLAPGAFYVATVDANLVLDPRYDAERWMEEHVRAGDLIETHGLNVYLPRFPSRARVIRVGPEKGKNPMPGIEEVADRFGNAPARGAKYIVVSEGWAWRYLFDPSTWSKTGRVVPKTQIVTAADEDGASFFQGLRRGERGYHEVHASRWTSELWPRLDIHASTAREIWIFERN
jgi:hypothetical protein